MLWTWQPPSATWPNYTIPSSQSLILNGLSIPTSQLTAGQIYSMKIVTVSIPSASSLVLTLTFAVTEPPA
jgi:hypothetical protein